MKHWWRTAAGCILSFKGWRVPVEASWLRVESRWQEDSEKKKLKILSYVWKVPFTRDISKYGQKLCSGCTWELMTNWNSGKWWEIKYLQQDWSVPSLLRQEHILRKHTINSLFYAHLGYLHHVSVYLLHILWAEITSDRLLCVLGSWYFNIRHGTRLDSLAKRGGWFLIINIFMHKMFFFFPK